MTEFTPDYPYTYTTPTTNFYIDHNYYVSTGVYGNFYNYDGYDASNNIILANSFIQRDISISGNVYCTSLYNYIDNKILNSLITSVSGIVSIDMSQYLTMSSFIYYKSSNDLYLNSISGSLNNIYIHR